MSVVIDSPSKRAKLPVRRNPFWHGISGGRGGVSLGYRKPARGPGSWVAKIVLNAVRVEERLGNADDAGSSSDAITFRAAVGAALEWGKQQHAIIEAAGPSGPTALTVRSAIEAYCKSRARRSAATAKNAEGRLGMYVLADAKFADTKLAKLRAETIEKWRDKLPVRDDAENEGAHDERARPRGDGLLARATVNRLLNDLRAALNAAAEKHRRELPAHLPIEIKIGTRALPSAVVARKQLLSEAEVRRAIEAAFEVDETGDFGRLVLVAATTGSRFSQIAKLTVGHVQPDQQRIMVPGSRKGRATKAKPPAAVSVSPEVVARLSSAIEGRRATDRLLERWSYREVKLFKWERHRRRPWAAAYEVEKFWSATVEKAELPAGTIMYALRHSSIVRGLRVGLPTRLVAALHDTSTEMIEEHYAAYIVDATEDLSRRAALAL